MVVKDYVAANMASYGDEVGDVAGYADVAESVDVADDVAIIADVANDVDSLTWLG